MTLQERVYAQALTLAGEVREEQLPMLQVLCRGAVNDLTGRLREGLRPEDCLADFVSAASLMALAALSEISEDGVERFTAGDVTIQRSEGSAAVNCLRYQAKLMMMPYIAYPFAFRGV